MARRPATYFKVTRILYGGLALPDLDRLSRQQNLTVGTLRQRLVDANPGWRGDAISIRTNRRGWLEEIRFCYSRRFMPAPCRARGRSDGAGLKIWRGL